MRNLKKIGKHAWIVNKYAFAAVIISLLLFEISVHGNTFAGTDPETRKTAVSAIGGKNPDYRPLTDCKPPVINAMSAILVEESTGRVLYSKNSVEKRPIASITKIMTAIVALENGNPADTVTVGENAASTGGSVAGFRAGEKYTLRDMLYALLMVSANDSAVAIAEHIGGTVENFARMMNKKALSIGAVNSNFVTPHGLDRENQYSTAYDVALITRVALKNPLFAEIVSTPVSRIPGHDLYNTNELLGTCKGVDGVKTGYTGRAGRCLVTTAKRGEMRLISVVLGSPTRSARADASRKLLDFGFSNFSMHKLLDSGEIYAVAPVYRGRKENVPLKVDEDVVLPLSDTEVEAIRVRSFIPSVLKAPLYAGADTGFVEYEINGEVVSRTALKASENIMEKTYLDYLHSIFRSWCRLMRNGAFRGAPALWRCGAGMVMPAGTADRPAGTTPAWHRYGGALECSAYVGYNSFIAEGKV